ncbi:shikimate dehydrogenase family protein [Pedobacter faecalis]|uniref:shikimate dehydrogenase family protein n=1 Tax=Pedobacter faecalis TaxID=3041495 RepID=UPI00254C116A|nr:shikimate dehydrogenase [Pedobacter sp. ELA7]
MRKFGLIGFPLSHSFSKKFFTEKFQKEQIAGCSYELYPIREIGMLPALLAENTTLEGINVTIPYKLDVMPFLTEVDEAALEIGAVNCISVDRCADALFLKGYNTDAYGFEQSLLPLLEHHHRKALIFGDGGAAKAVKYVLKKLKIPFLVVSRRLSDKTIPYEQLNPVLLAEYTVLINTTPLGMSPDYETYPLFPYEALTPEHLAYDLVYNPEETTFLRKVRERSGKTKNGLEMLYLQAERSWHIWNL